MSNPLYSLTGGKFIDQNFAKKAGFNPNAEGTTNHLKSSWNKNKTGLITSFVTLNLKTNGKIMATELMVTGLGKQKKILGFPWLINTTWTSTGRLEGSPGEPHRDPSK
jgi:hypothetical protein